ncbi:MAG: DNA polymerase III subunit delta [Bradymonadales bacterium]|jgi:DNA polymerase-3 subunit delta
MSKKDIDESEKLIKHLLSSDPLEPVYLIYGEESYIIDEAIELLAKKRFKGEEIDALSWEQYRAADKDLQFRRVVDSLRTVSMFGGPKVIILREAEVLPESSLQLLVEYVKKPAQRAHLVIVASKLDMRKKSWASLKKGAFSAQCAPLSEYQAASWIAEQARLKKINLNREAIDYLSMSIGPNRSMIAQNLEKIAICFPDAQSISLKDIEDHVVDTRERSVFELTRAISKRKLEGAMLAFRALIAQNQDPIAINAMIARQARMSLQVKLAQTLRLSDQDMMSRFRIPFFALKEYKEAAHSYSLGELYRLHSLCFEADRELKSMPIPKHLVIEKLLIANHGK